VCIPSNSFSFGSCACCSLLLAACYLLLAATGTVLMPRTRIA